VSDSEVHWHVLCCVMQGGEGGGFSKHTYIQSICITVCIGFFHGIASLCMARHTSIWLCSIFLIFSVCLFLPTHTSNQSIQSPSHPIHINSTTFGFVFVCLHLTRLYLLVSSHSTFFQVLKYFFLLRSNHPSLTLFSLSFSLPLSFE
jgi:hypothetical protein